MTCEVLNYTASYQLQLIGVYQIQTPAYSQKDVYFLLVRCTGPKGSEFFHLFADKSQGIAKFVLTQNFGPWLQPVAYLSKKLDSVAQGWPACLYIVAAAALLVKDADKITMRQELMITTLHAIEGVLKPPRLLGI